MLYPGTEKVFGPYVRNSDGRRIVVLYGKDFRRTVSYPKLLVEVSMCKRILDSETVDHIDKDFNNDSLDNLRVLDRSEHQSQDVIRNRIPDLICQVCSSHFIPKPSTISNYQRKDRYFKGPFCSRSCAGKASRSMDAYVRLDFDLTKYCLKDIK